MKNNDSYRSWFVWIVKKARFENILHEPQNIIKKQEVRPQNLTSVHCGWRELAEKEQKIVINYSELLEHRTEILARKDIIHQIWLTMKAG